MIIETTEELAEFTRKKLENSKKPITEIAEMSEISTKSVDHGISKGERFNSGRDGVRRKILSALGYDVKKVYQVTKIKE